ncbi:MAG: PPOX class F420-dependent oxidoreductase [Nitrososphaerota archaeon]|nr:PPOX class F420-dependent oxidoreductase [Nitrososphaerota archaeon]
MVHQTSAADTNAEASATVELARFQKQRVLSLESYKKSGEPKRTPVIFVELDRKLYFQTALKSWKAKRVLKNPNVRVAPSTFRGTPKADWLHATATKVEVEEEVKRIRSAFGKKFGFLSRITFFLEQIAWGEIGFFCVNLDLSRPQVSQALDAGERN